MPGSAGGARRQGSPARMLVSVHRVQGFTHRGQLIGPRGPASERPGRWRAGSRPAAMFTTHDGAPCASLLAAWLRPRRWLGLRERRPSTATARRRRGASSPPAWSITVLLLRHPQVGAQHRARERLGRPPAEHGGAHDTPGRGPTSARWTSCWTSCQHPLCTGQRDLGLPARRIARTIVRARTCAWGAASRSGSSPGSSSRRAGSP